MAINLQVGMLIGLLEILIYSAICIFNVHNMDLCKLTKRFARVHTENLIFIKLQRQGNALCSSLLFVVDWFSPRPAGIDKSCPTLYSPFEATNDSMIWSYLWPELAHRLPFDNKIIIRLEWYWFIEQRFQGTHAAFNSTEC